MASLGVFKPFWPVVNLAVPHGGEVKQKKEKGKDKTSNEKKIEREKERKSPPVEKQIPSPLKGALTWSKGCFPKYGRLTLPCGVREDRLILSGKPCSSHGPKKRNPLPEAKGVSDVGFVIFHNPHICYCFRQNNEYAANTKANLC